jgi:hypothetical protein
MATYTVINELQAIEFHDSSLNNAYIDAGDLHLVFSSAIIIGHSLLDINGRIPCSVNDGEDRYACPELKVIVHNFILHSVLRGGCWTKDAEGNTIAKYPPRNLLPEEYAEFLQMVFAEKNNHVYGITFDAETQRYTLGFFMNTDANYYEIEFTGDSIIAEFDEFGKDAWYLDSKQKNRNAEK